MVSPIVPADNTKLIVKYHPLAIKESVVDHTWMVRSTVLVEPSNHNLARVALFLFSALKFVGGTSILSQDHHKVWILNQLILRLNTLFDISGEMTFNVPVVVNSIPVAVAHHISVDQVDVIFHHILIITFARTDHVFPAKS